MEEGKSLNEPKNRKFRLSHDVDHLNESYSYNGDTFKTEDEFKIDTKPAQKINFLAKPQV